MNEANKIEAKLVKKQNREFANMFHKVASKLKSIQSTKSAKKRLIKDLENCNSIDLVHFLTLADFKTQKEYITCINAFLELETTAYQYPYKLEYKVGSMKTITKLITLFHRKLELLKHIQE